MRHPTPQHQKLVDLLREIMPTLSGVRAAWLGGSYAFDSQDAMSDIDLLVCADAADAEGIFEGIEVALAERFGIDHIAKMPLMGDPHRFFRTKELGPQLLVDCYIASPANLGKQVNIVQHGQPQILFDPHGELAAALASEPARNEALIAALRQELPTTQARYRMHSPFLAKAIARKDIGDAFSIYQQVVVSALVKFLRAKHVAARQNFGLRYLRQDLPLEIAERIEGLILPASLEAMGECARAADAWLGELFGWVEAQSW